MTQKWIEHPLKLEGEHVILLPLEETHFEDLIRAGESPQIWTFLPLPSNNREHLITELKDAILQRKNEAQYPFVVIEKVSQKIIGSTRYLKLNPTHRSLEIGWTWYQPDYWGKGYNDACKLLLLTYAFEVLKTIRVQIIAAEKNSPSRKAIERIGGRFEGIFRNYVIRYDGKRNCAIYSIIEEEWKTVKTNLIMRLKTYIFAK